MRTLKDPTGHLRSMPGLLMAILAAGVLLTWWLAVRADRELREDLLGRTRLVAGAMTLEQLGALTGSAADLESTEYLRLKEQFAAIRAAEPDCRFVYLLGRKADLPAGTKAAQAGGNIFFFLDSEPAGSEDESPAGQVYQEAPEGFRRVFDTRKAAVVGPVSDRWGTWVTALVPLTDSQRGDVLAVLGVDFDARDWKWNVAARAALPIGLMLALVIVLLVAVAGAGRVSASPEPVVRRLLPSLAVLLLLVFAGAGALLWQQHRAHLSERTPLAGTQIMQDLRNALAQQAQGLAAAALPIAADPRVRQALRAGGTERLLADWQSLFETLHREQSLTHFYFFDKNRVCLLRVHKPERRGDTIDRFTAREAERTGKTASGIEVGPLGTFTLRVVQPVFDGDTRVGYVELGKEIEDVLRNLHRQSGREVAAVLRKDAVTRGTWEAGMRMLGREADWDRLPHSVILFASQGRLPDAFVPLADPGQADGHAHGVTDWEVATDGRHWRVKALPLQDASGKEVGDLLVMSEITADRAAFARLTALGGGGGAVLLAALLGLVFVVLRRTDAGIRAQQAQLREGERSYRQQFANNSAMMLLIDPADGAIVDANAAAVRFYGYPRERLVAMAITDINILPAGEVRQAMASVTSESGRRFEFQHRLADGTLRDVEVSASSISFGRRTVLHSIVHDVTERKKAEEALRESEQRFDLAINGTGA
ncbi:MAG: cache domain-containing protein, partial [Vicinamibacterales bacterium]|nr:cache domain-containing protein [Vicinamibacterales bacterium]